jgi:hypothetical protein
MRTAHAACISYAASPNTAAAKSNPMPGDRLALAQLPIEALGAANIARPKLRNRRRRAPGWCTLMNLHVACP